MPTLGLLVGALAAAAASPPPPTSTFVIADATDVTMGRDVTITNAGCPSGSVSLRSGGQHSTSAATVTTALSPGITVTGVAFAYKYTTGYSGPVGSNFSLVVAGKSVFASPPLTLFPYSKTGDFSPATPVAAKGLAIKVAPGTDRLVFHFQNNDRNMQLLLPMTISVTCTGGVNGSCAPPAPPKPAQVFMSGEHITGFNPTRDSRAYGCFRIPSLLALPSGKLLAFAEGRADGCKPDVHSNRPVVVRVSEDEGQTWGNISIAGPAISNVGTNYPGAFLRDNSTVALRYKLSNGSVFETTSEDEGATWGSPVEASQPPTVEAKTLLTPPTPYKVMPGYVPKDNTDPKSVKTNSSLTLADCEQVSEHSLAPPSAHSPSPSPLRPG